MAAGKAPGVSVKITVLVKTKQRVDDHRWTCRTAMKYLIGYNMVYLPPEPRLTYRGKLGVTPGFD